MFTFCVYWGYQTSKCMKNVWKGYDIHWYIPQDKGFFKFCRTSWEKKQESEQTNKQKTQNEKKNNEKSQTFIKWMLGRYTWFTEYRNLWPLFLNCPGGGWGEIPSVECLYQILGTKMQLLNRKSTLKWGIVKLVLCFSRNSKKVRARWHKTWILFTTA